VLQFWERYREATARRVERDFAAAAGLYRAALELDPRHEDCLYYLGQCQRELGQPGDARRSFERLVEVNPNSGRGHLALGALLASPDPAEPLDLATAEEHLRLAHGINGEETGPMVRLAEVLIVSGRTEEARRWLEDAARTNPRSVEAPFLAACLAWDAREPARAQAFAAKARGAARASAPVKGVLGEGDRKAPPLENPMGRLLFGDALAAVRDEARREAGAAPPGLDGPCRAVARARAEHSRRARS
jgi:tetratricopeptide (TPR) repeat protein